MDLLAGEARVPCRGYHALRHAAGLRAARIGMSHEAIAAFLGLAYLQDARQYRKWADAQVGAPRSAT